MPTKRGKTTQSLVISEIPIELKLRFYYLTKFYGMTYKSYFTALVNQEWDKIADKPSIELNPRQIRAMESIVDGGAGPRR